MKWSNTITLQQPLLDVRLLTKAPVLDWQDHLRDSERTAHEQGRREGERALGEQLLQQRNEMAELQNGVINSANVAANRAGNGINLNRTRPGICEKNC